MKYCGITSPNNIFIKGHTHKSKSCRLQFEQCPVWFRHGERQTQEEERGEEGGEEGGEEPGARGEEGEERNSEEE